MKNYDSNILEENKIEFEVWGKRALFTDPISKTCGEKSTYHIPTYEAIKGIAKSIHWKPTFTYVIDKIRIMNLTQTMSELKRRGELSSPKTQVARYTFLTDVAYQVQAHIIWNKYQINLADDRNAGKHLSMIQRHLKRPTLPVCLGLSECNADVNPCQFGEGTSDYDKINEMQFSLMFHSFQYPDDIGENKLYTCHWRPKMCTEIINGREVGGVVKFPSTTDFPNEKKGLHRKFIKNMDIELFKSECQS